MSIIVAELVLKIAAGRACQKGRRRSRIGHELRTELVQLVQDGRGGLAGRGRAILRAHWQHVSRRRVP